MEVSIGARLKQAREQRRLTIAEVSEATRVRVHYLQALENDDFTSMPSTAQARGFLRIYAAFLGLDLASLVPPPPEAPAGATAAVPSASEAPEQGPSVLDRVRSLLSKRAQKEPEIEAPAPTAKAAAAPQTPPITEPAGVPAAGEPKTKPVDEPPSASEPKKKVPESPATVELATTPAAEGASEVEWQPDEHPAFQREEGSPQEVPPTPRPSLGARLGHLFSALHAAKESAPPTAAAPETAAPAEEDELPPAERGTLTNVRDFNPLPAEEGEEGEGSDAIFAEIGRTLRARREMLSLTREEIERHIKIREEFLAALEAGAPDGLPSAPQTRGILANYAAFLDLDVDEVMLRFADALQARHREHKPEWESPRTRAPMTVHTSLPPLRAFIASDLLFGGGVAIMLILFSIWGISRVMAVRSANVPRATAPSISEVLAGTPVPTIPQQVTLIPAEDTPLAVTASATIEVAAATLDPNFSVSLQLKASERTYLRVISDGNVVFDGRADIGQDFVYQATRQVEVLVGNGSALRVTYNGQDLGLMGSFGEVVDRLYTAQGVVTPTSTPAPTRTPSPTPSPTQSLTPTLATYTPTTRPGD